MQLARTDERDQQERSGMHRCEPEARAFRRRIVCRPARERAKQRRRFLHRRRLGDDNRDLAAEIEAERRQRKTADDDDAIVGFFNLSHITRGLLQSAYLGYAADKPYAGNGYMRQGIQLVLRNAFLNLRLHRVEANIQPGNSASIALARGAGFRREGFSPRYLKIGGRWRDHERWAILSDENRISQKGRRFPR